MKEITCPKLFGVDRNGKQWGLVEYLLDVVFIRAALYSDKDFCDCIAELQPKLLPLRGEAQVEVTFKLTDTSHKVLVNMGLPDPRLEVLPETQFGIAQARLAILSAKEVKEKPPKEKAAKSE
jgi:hypothetical protein